MPFPDNSFDGAWCHVVLSHLELIKDVRTAIQEFYRVLKPEGIIHLYTKAYLTGPEVEVSVSYFFKKGRLFRYLKLAPLKK